MKKLLTSASLGAVLVVAAVVMAVPAVSQAAYVGAGRTISVSSSTPINENVYLAGGTVSTAVPVKGDLLAAGGTLFLSGAVTQDIMAAGGNITITNASAQDIRIAGGNLMMSGTFSGEMMAAGGQIIVTPDTKIAKDSYLAGGSITFNGAEAGSLDLAGGSIYINGSVGKDLFIKNAKDVTIGPNAVISGNFEYTAMQAATIDKGAAIKGSTTFHVSQTPAPQNGFLNAIAGILAFGWIVKFLAVLLGAYLLWYVLRGDMTEVVRRATFKFGWELLRGLGVLVLVPIGFAIALITVIGALPAIVVALVYVVLLMIAVPMNGLVIASFLVKRRVDLKWYHILLGVAVVEVVGVIPVIGWLAVFVFYLAALGALSMVFWQRLMKKA